MMASCFRSRRLRASDERGVVLVVVVAMMLVLGLFAAAVLATGIVGSRRANQTTYDKQAYAAALTGLRVGLEHLNTSVQPANGADVTWCPSLPDGTTASADANGVCGPYTSDATPGGAAASPGTKYRYWLTTVSPSLCTGATPFVTTNRQTTFKERCLTAEGTAYNGTTLMSTKRIEARLTSSNTAFPIPGVWGTQCVTINPNGNFGGSTTCKNSTAGNSNSSYYGSIGSNGQILAGLSAWYDDPSLTSPSASAIPCVAIAKTCPASLYLGTDGPGKTSTTQSSSYSIKTAGAGSQPGSQSTCPPGSFGNGNTYTNPCVPYYDQGNRATYFGFYFPLPMVGSYFAKPSQPVYGTTSSGAPDINNYMICNANCDTATTNNNSVLGDTVTNTAPSAANGASYSCAGSPYTSTGRKLAIGAGCTLSLPDGTYNFCTIDMAASSRILPSLQTTSGLPVSPASKAEVRIFLDNATRTGSGCTGVTNAGKLTSPSNLGASAVPTWMTSATSVNNCSALYTDSWTPLAGQLFVYGAAESPAGQTQSVASSLDLPNGKFLFDGVLLAPNSTLNVQGQSSCVRGALEAGAMNIAANLTFLWDSSADLILNPGTPTYYRTAFSQCVPTVGTNPMDGC